MRALGVQRSFYLSALPVDESLAVHVEDRGVVYSFEREIDWTYDPIANAVTFVESIRSVVSERKSPSSRSPRSPIPVPSRYKLVSPVSGFAVTQPVKEGYILRPHESVLHLYEMTTGKSPVVFPLNMQDITPYESGVHHVCGMALPSIFSPAPVIGVPLAMEVPIMPAATGTQQPAVLETAGRFCLEIAGAFGRGDCEFYYQSDFDGFVEAYGNIRGWQARY